MRKLLLISPLVLAVSFVAAAMDTLIKLAHWQAVCDRLVGRLETKNSQIVDPAFGSVGKEA